MTFLVPVSRSILNVRFMLLLYDKIYSLVTSVLIVEENWTACGVLLEYIYESVRRKQEGRLPRWPTVSTVDIKRRRSWVRFPEPIWKTDFSKFVQVGVNSVAMVPIVLD